MHKLQSNLVDWSLYLSSSWVCAVQHLLSHLCYVAAIKVFFFSLFIRMTKSWIVYTIAWLSAMSDRCKCTGKTHQKQQNTANTLQRTEVHWASWGNRACTDCLPLLFEVYSVCHRCLIIYVSNMRRRFIPVLLTQMYWHWCVAGVVKYRGLHYYVISILIKVEESSFVGNDRRNKSGKVECGNGSLCKHV